MRELRSPPILIGAGSSIGVSVVVLCAIGVAVLCAIGMEGGWIEEALRHRKTKISTTRAQQTNKSSVIGEWPFHRLISTGR